MKYDRMVAGLEDARRLQSDFLDAWQPRSCCVVGILNRRGLGFRGLGVGLGFRG